MTANPGAAELQLGIAMSNPGTAELQLGTSRLANHRREIPATSSVITVDDLPAPRFHWVPKPNRSDDRGFSWVEGVGDSEFRIPNSELSYPTPMTLVAGADVTKGRWVVVVLRDGNFDRATVTKTLTDFLAEIKGLEVLAVDIPIGLPEAKEHRRCDLAAKAFLKPRSSTVFFTPPRPVLEAPTYQKGNHLSWHDYERGVSAQAYALGQKILEVDPVAAGDDRIIEVHPEVCFRAMKGGPLDDSKHSWNGQTERRRLIAGAGIDLPDHLPDAGEVPPDDLLDAAAAAWSAWRVVLGEAKILPESAAGCDTNRRAVIWY